jgi:hypothetical protein
VHALVEQFAAGTSESLGPVDSYISALQQVLGALVLVCTQGNADADGGRMIAPGYGKRCCDSGLKALRYTKRVARIGDAFQKNREFITAQAG